MVRIIGTWNQIGRAMSIIQSLRYTTVYRVLLYIRCHLFLFIPMLFIYLFMQHGYVLDQSEWNFELFFFK